MQRFLIESNRRLKTPCYAAVIDREVGHWIILHRLQAWVAGCSSVPPRRCSCWSMAVSWGSAGFWGIVRRRTRRNFVPTGADRWHRDRPAPFDLGLARICPISPFLHRGPCSSWRVCLSGSGHGSAMAVPAGTVSAASLVFHDARSWQPWFSSPLQRLLSMPSAMSSGAER